MAKTVQEKEQHFHAIINTLKEINQLVVKEKDAQHLTKKICETLVNIRGYHFVYGIIMSHNNKVELIENAGNAGGFERIKENALKGIFPEIHRKVLATKKLGEHTAKQPDYALTIEKEKWTLLIAPIPIDNESEGLLCAAVSYEDANHPKEKTTFQDIANSLGFAISSIREKQDIAEMIDSAPEVQVIFNNKLIITSVNRAFCQMFGVVKSKIQHKHIKTVLLENFPEQEHPKLNMAIEELAKGNDIDIELEGKEKYYQLFTKLRSLTKYRIGVVRDITKEKLEKKEIKESETKYRNLVNSLSDSVFILQDKKIKYVNPTLCSISGYSEEELINNDFSRFITKKEIEKIIELYKQRIKGQTKLKSYNSVTQTKSGKQIQVKVTVIPVDFEGRPAYQIILRDISAEQKALKQLKESEQRFRFFSESSFEGIIIHDNGIIIDANQAILKLSGYTKEELTGKSIFDFTATTKDFESLKDNLLKSQPKPIVLSIRIKNGEVVQGRIESREIIYNGKKVRIAGLHDVTKQYKLSKEVKEARETIDNLLNNLPGMAYSCLNNKNWDMLFMSQGCFDLTGYRGEEFITKKNIEFKNLIHPEDRQYVWDSIQTDLSDNKPFELEYRIITKDGTEKWIWERGRKLNDKSGIPILEGFISDITERKNAEDALKKSETNYRSLFNSISDAIVIHPFHKTQIHKFVEVNEPACKMFGYTRKEFLELTARDLTLDSEKNKIISQKNRKHLLKDGYTNCEIEQQTKSGQIITVEISSQVFFVDGKKRIMSLIRDISERKKQEEKIKHLVNDLTTILDNDPTFIIYKDTKNNILRITKTVSKITGLPKEKIEGKHSKVVYPEMAEKYYEDDLKVIKSGEPLMNIVEELKTITGEKKWLLTNKIPIKQNGRDVSGIIQFSTDITKIIQFKKELIEKNEQLKVEKQKVIEAGQRYESLFTNSASAMFLVNPDNGKIVDANKAACDFYGYSYSDFISLNIKQINTLAESDLRAEMENAKNKNRNQFYFKHRLANGTVKDVEVHSDYVSFAGKSLLYSIVHDVTGRKEAETQLMEAKRQAEENEQKFIAFMNFIPGQAFIKDKDLNFLFVNRFMEKNLNAKDWIGKNSRNVLHPSIQDRVIKDDRITFKQGRHKFEEFFPVVGRGIRDFLTYKFTIDSKEKQTLLGGISIDITERKQLEKKNSMLSKAIESSPLSVIITNKEGKIEYVNPFFEEKTGYSLQEVIGRNPNILKSGKQDNNFYKELWDTIISGKNWYGEFHNKTKSGELFWEQASISPVTNSKGEIVQFIAIKEDVTNLKQTLEDLKKAKDKAEESDRLKSSFLANMSHEIRTPMNGILGFTELLREPDLTGEQQQEFIDIIRKSGDRMLNTINNIIDISKIESGIEVVNNVDIDLKVFLSDIYYFFQPEAIKKGIKLEFINEFYTVLPTIHTDPDKLNSILINLIKNALKFTHEGSISFGYTLQKGIVRFFVRDTGIGIPEHRQKAVFDRFVQADIADSRVFEGSGLGLSISNMYTKMLGGSIKLRSNEGEGTVFYVDLPQKPADTGQTTKVIEIDEPMNMEESRLKILIVEDDEISVQLLKLFLKKIGKQLIYATTGIEAIEMAKNNPDLDLILMDIKLPEMDGFEATERIREFNENVKIIAQTAFAQPEDNLKAFKVGCNDFLTKPVNKKALHESIKKLFNNSLYS